MLHSPGRTSPDEQRPYPRHAYACLRIQTPEAVANGERWDDSAFENWLADDGLYALTYSEDELETERDEIYLANACSDDHRPDTNDGGVG